MSLKRNINDLFRNFIFSQGSLLQRFVSLHAKTQRAALKPQRLQGPWCCPFEEPARAHFQAMVPGG
jgi:hypothetical protein